MNVKELTTRNRGLIGVALFAALIAADAAFNHPTMDGESATAACQSFIRDRLKTPATAEFSNLTPARSGTAWTVAGSVDAENAFGTRVRMDWTCTVQAEGDTWRLDALTGLSS